MSKEKREERMLAWENERHTEHGTLSLAISVVGGAVGKKNTRTD